MSTETIEPPKVKIGASRSGKPEPAAPVHPAVKALAEYLQDRIHEAFKGQTLPTMRPGQPPLEEYTDETGKKRVRTRRAVELDAQGNPILGSGPVIADQAAKQMLEMLIPHAEQWANYAAARMSECLLHPDSHGHIDDRAKLVLVPPGRFVFVPGTDPVRGG